MGRSGYSEAAVDNSSHAGQEYALEVGTSHRWWNWQTRKVQVLVLDKGVEVRVLSGAPRLPVQGRGKLIDAWSFRLLT